MDTVEGKDVDTETKVSLLLLGERASPNSHMIAVGYANVGHMHEPAVGLNEPCLEPLHAHRMRTRAGHLMPASSFLLR